MKNKIGDFEILINSNEFKIINKNNDVILSAHLNPLMQSELSVWVDYNFTKHFEFNSSELQFTIKDN